MSSRLLQNMDYQPEKNEWNFAILPIYNGKENGSRVSHFERKYP